MKRLASGVIIGGVSGIPSSARAAVVAGIPFPARFGPGRQPMAFHSRHYDLKYAADRLIRGQEVAQNDSKWCPPSLVRENMRDEDEPTTGDIQRDDGHEEVVWASHAGRFVKEWWANRGLQQSGLCAGRQPNSRDTTSVFLVQIGHQRLKELRELSPRFQEQKKQERKRARALVPPVDWKWFQNVCASARPHSLT